jgi:uncharacterized membrane protein (UPF0136 family)
MDLIDFSDASGVAPALAMAVFVAVGGIIGLARKGSTASAATGLPLALLYVYAASVMEADAVLGNRIAFGATMLLGNGALFLAAFMTLKTARPLAVAFASMLSALVHSHILQNIQ